jgi:hypothetical protein
VKRKVIYNLQMHSNLAASFDMSAIQVRTWSFLRQEKYLDLLGIETRFLRNPARSGHNTDANIPAFQMYSSLNIPVREISIVSVVVNVLMRCFQRMYWICML